MRRSIARSTSSRARASLPRRSRRRCAMVASTWRCIRSKICPPACRPAWYWRRCPSGDPAEALVTREAGVTSIADLAAGARLGTSSLRRVAQVRYLRADLDVVPLRGNVPTRVQKVKEGRDGLDAALLAGAGLERLQLAGQIAARLDPLDVMPAPGQGALGLEVRADDRKARAALAPLEDRASACQVAAERALLASLEGGCQAPVAAWVGMRDVGGGMRLFGRVTAQDGSVQLTASADIDENNPVAAGVAVADLLRAQGASRLLGR